MGNHQFRFQSTLNVSFDHVVDSGIPEEEWAEMTEGAKAEARNEALWDNVDVSDEENR